MSASSTATLCPWCGRSVDDLEAECANCHRSPAQHPSLRSKNDATAGSDFELELGSMPPSAVPKSRKAAAPAERQEPSTEGDEPEAEAAPPLDLALDGDLGPAQATLDRAPGSGAGFSADGLDDDDEIEALQVDLAMGEPDRDQPVDARAAVQPPSATASQPHPAPAGPSGPSGFAEPLAAAPEVSEFEVQQLANYGVPPPSILSAIPYAWRVLRRRAELRRLLVVRQESDQRVQIECRSRFVDMVAAVRQSAPEDQVLQERFADLHQVEALVQSRASQLEQAQQTHAAQVGQVDQNLTGMLRDRETLEQQRDEAQQLLDRCTEERDRAQALAKRVEIQLRALHDAARQAAGKGAKFAPPEHARKITEAQAVRDQHHQVLKGRQQTFDQARQALGVQQAALRELDRRMEAVKGRRRDIQKTGTAQQQLVAQGVEQAEGQLLDRCEQGIRRLLTERHPALGQDMPKEIVRLDERLRASVVDLEMHRRAVDAYDRKAVRTAIVLVAVLSLLVLVALVMLVRVGG